MRLNHNDLILLAESLQELYAATDAEKLPSVIISILAILVPSTSASYNEIGPEGRQLVTMIVPHLTNLEKRLPHLIPVFHEHPVVQHFHKTGSMEPFKFTDFFSKAQFHETAIYNEFYRYYNIQDQISFFFGKSHQHNVAMAINRDRANFSSRDRELLKLLRPHLSQAMSNALAFGEARSNEKLSSEACWRRGQSLVWVDFEGVLATSS